MAPDVPAPESSRRRFMALLGSSVFASDPAALVSRSSGTAQALARFLPNDATASPAALTPEIAADLSTPALGLRQGWVLLHTDL